MRVAYVCADPGVPVFGRKGASVHVREVIRALMKRGAEVTLLARRLGGEAPPELRSVDTVQLPVMKSESDEQRELQLLAGNDELTRHLSAAGPFDLVYERHALWSHGAMEFAAERGIASVLEVNAPLIDEQARYRSLIHAERARESAARAIAAAGSVAAVSDMVAEYVQELAPGRGRVHVIANGVDAERFGGADREVSPAIEPLPGVVTVGFVGTLKPWHGIETLVEAAAMAAQQTGLRLLIVGDGPQRPRIEAKAAQLGISQRTVLTGAIDPEQVPAHVASMDIAAAPYPALERFYFSPLKIYEYMAGGRAIVASRIGEIERAIEHGVTGVLVAPGDAGALAEAIVGLTQSPATRQAIGRAARVQAQARHTWDAVAGRILQIAGVEPAGATP